MSARVYEILTVAPNFYQLGTPSYPAYLSMGDSGMIIEGGTGATFPIIVDQIKELGIEPERIKYIALTHTHPDHVGAVPHLKKLWPHLKVVGSERAAKQLQKEEFTKNFISVDQTITEILLVKGDIERWSDEPENAVFDVDMIVGEGEKIDLGGGVVWTVCETPGHSPCHISFHNERDGILVIGDATGIYEPDKEFFWPNYFQSLEEYCQSIRKLAALPARIGVRSHGGVVAGEPRSYLQRVMRATKSYHRELLGRVANGEDPEEVILEKAKWVYTFTNLQPFKLIHIMTGVTLKRSQSIVDEDGLFDIPD
jgi:glyoxylase-like metal-dependent hydrolase (beta-lactamase superfamily II)